MKRRGNKSSKVPNVKLRPAQEGSYSKKVDGEIWAQDSQAGSDNLGMVDLCPRPFRGVVICATGIVDKPTLFKKALELGATSVSAFTDRVTHLVANDHGSAKYMCALERKIPIVVPEWVDECYQIWLRGDDVDVTSSVEKHRLPIFLNVVVCPSGIADILRRTKISKLVTQNHGTYLQNLERPVKVTHLLCSGDEETEKMRYAEKFNSRGEAKIHLVWEEWFWDCLEFGGRFDEKTYQVRRPRPERKTIEEAASSPPPSSALPSEHDEERGTSKAHSPKLTKPQEELEDEPAEFKVLPSVTLQLWGGLLERRGYEIAGGEILRSPSKSQGVHKPQPPPESPTKLDTKSGSSRSVISSFRRANSFAPIQKDTGVPQRQLPFRRTTSVLMQAQATRTKDVLGGSAHQKVGETSSSGAAKGMFAGFKFRTLGEAKTPNVRSAIEQYGGVMVSDDDDDVDFIIVRLVSGSKLYREEPDETLRPRYRTECWLERCIFEDRVFPAEDHVSFVPLGIPIPLPRAEMVNMSISGFDQSESCGIKRLLRALGLNLASTFSRRSTHLLCPSGTGPKFDKACEWNIPIVDVGWLSAMAKSGTIIAVDEHLVPGCCYKSPVDLESSEDMTVDVKGKGKAIDKGKGKATYVDTGYADPDLDSMMNDITNGSRTESPRPLSPVPEPQSSKKSHSKQSSPRILQKSLSGSREFSFGQPNETLNGSLPRHPSCTPPLISTPTPKANTHPTAQSISQKNLTGSLPIPRLSAREIETEKKNSRIPSSKSPSPMKLPRQTSRSSLSPVKIDNEATKALQDSITSLLGKRQSPDEDESSGVRNGKRLRPQRSKLQSRQPSVAQLNAEISDAPVSMFTINPYESYDDLNVNDSGGKEESVRVMYEDPGQRDEKKRLMNLLKSQAEDVLPGSGKGGKSLGRTRKSARIAGF